MTPAQTFTSFETALLRAELAQLNADIPKLIEKLQEQMARRRAVEAEIRAMEGKAS
jgi:hypothetical protein